MAWPFGNRNWSEGEGMFTLPDQQEQYVKHEIKVGPVL